MLTTRSSTLRLMPALPDSVLEAQYKAATYEVDFPSGTIAFRVGDGPPRKPSFVILTAFNPGHERPSPRANQAANEQLRGVLEDRGVAWLSARGMSADRRHIEPSFAVTDLGLDDALAIAREFRQAALFVWDGRRGSIAWC